MKLTALMEGVPGIVSMPEADAEIAALCSDSRASTPGALFFCTPGLNMDAHDFAPQAVEKGAAALIVERRLALPVPQVVVRSVRTAMSYIASNFYGHPWKRMTMIGSTGTKGKTTTSFLVKSILEAAGHKTGLIGTVCSMVGEETLPSTLTTPDPIHTQSLLKHMLDAGCTAVVMEVSAHALDMDRLAGIKFQVGAFSNFSQDHLDYFHTMDAYFEAKMRFMSEDMCQNIVYNIDDEHVAAGIRRLGRTAMRVGIRESSDIYANDIEIAETGTDFMMTWHKHFKIPVHLKIAGIFNVYNALMAAGIAVCAGLGPQAIRVGLEVVRAVPGRIELLDTKTPYRVILDYAHSPDSLENILTAVRQTAKRRLIALFGCGGNRDTGKRAQMGEIAGRLADYCILTSDNPRYEDPFEILDMIEEGIKKTDCPYVVIENRREAILYALKMAEDSDVVILAGKGHETYQEINGVKHPFDEKKVVAELLAEMAAENP